MKKNILITGASGYLGSEIINFLDYKKYKKIYLLSRNENSTIKPNIIWKRWKLGDEIDNKISKIDIVLHLAHDFNIKNNSSSLDNINYKGTIKLAEFFISRNHQCKFIFISTTSAQENALNQYGQTKLNIEKYLISNFNVTNILILRVGSIFGSIRKSFYGLFFNILKVVPVCIVPSKLITLQIIHLDSVIISIVYAIDNSVHGKYLLAGEDIYFDEYLKLLRRKATGRNLILISIPQFLILFFLKLLKFLPIQVVINLIERINGLVGAEPDRSEKFQEKFTLPLKNQILILKKSSSRRAYFVELINIFKLFGINAQYFKLRLIVRNFEKRFGISNSFSFSNILINFILIRLLPTTIIIKFSSNIYVKKILISLAYKSIKFPRFRSFSFISLVFGIISIPFLLLKFVIKR